MENIVRKRMAVCGVSALCALALAGGICLIAPPAAAQAETHDHSGWEELTSAGGEMGGGTYYLTDDVELQSDLSVTGEVTLCLNGHILKGTGQNNVISVQRGADFTLCDCNGSQSTHYYTVDEDGLYIFDGVTADTPEAQPLEGGVVTGKNTIEGGGIYVRGSTFTMEGGTIAGNDTDSGGGAFVYDSTFTMKGGAIVGNNADFGGGIYAQGSTVTITGNASIAGNLSQYGGGIYIYYESTLTIGENAAISENVSEGYGGGIFANTTGITMTGGTIAENDCTKYYGGGLYIDDSTMTMSGGTVKGNTAEGDGGGIYGYNGVQLTLSGEALISENRTEDNGGGIALEMNSSVTLEGGEVSDNFAYLHGGGIYVKEGAVTMKGGAIVGNDCNRDGGGIYSSDSTIDMSDGSIEGNQSCLKNTNGGGAIYANIDSTLTICGGQIVNNSIGEGLGGGAIYTHSDATLQLGGAPVIAGNTFNGVENNFFLRTEARLQFIAPLEEGAKIGVNLYNHDLEEEYRNTTGVFTQGYSAENTADPSQYFFADNAKYAVVWNEDGEAEIVVNSYTVICVGLDGTRTEREFTVGEPLTLDEVPAEEGYLGGWTQAYGGASIDYAGGQTLAEGLGQAPGDVITLYAVQARDLAGDVDGILSGLEQAAAALGSGDLAAGLASLTQQIGAAQEAIDALEGDRVTQDKLEAAVEAAQAALEEQIEAVQAELGTAVGQLQASIASGEADVAALEEGLAALEEALRAAETLLGGDISALEEQLGALEEAYAAADDAVMDAVEALRADNAAMTTALWLVGAAAVVALAAGAAALVVALTARKRS